MSNGENFISLFYSLSCPQRSTMNFQTLPGISFTITNNSIRFHLPYGFFQSLLKGSRILSIETYPIDFLSIL